MAYMSSLHFAIEASDRLRRIAHGLCADTSCVQFCASLEVILTDIIAWLQTLPNDNYSERHSEREAVALLKQLENLCQPLDLSSPINQSNTSPLAHKSALAQLLANSEAVTLAIRKLASDRLSQRPRRTILACLESFLPQVSEKIDTSPSDADLRAASEDPPECGKEITSLYKALFKNCFCTSSEEMIARIRLRSSSHDDTKVTFGVLFMAHPHRNGPDLESQPWWQDTHISVPRAVNFDAITGTERIEIGVDPDAPFCSYISAQEEEGLIHLYFSITGQTLYFEDSQDSVSQWEFDRPSISLGQLLQEISESANDLTEKRKEVLSWLLAKAVWQYYSSPWMLQPWNKENLHFLFERRRTEEGHELAGIFVNEPLLSVSIVPEPPITQHAGPSPQQVGGTKNGPKRRLLPFSGRPLHRIPKLLALGIMLVEIQLGRTLESLHGEAEWSQYCPRGKQNPNTNYKICKDLIAQPKFFADVSDPLETLIRSCIEGSDIFMPPRVRDEDGIRQELYKLINRLEIYLSKRKPHSVKPISLNGNLLLKDPPLNTPSFAVKPPLPASQRNPRRFARPGRTMAQISSSTSTKRWFEKMQSFNYILKAAESYVHDRIKIAVLDTGVDPNDAAAVYISGYRDFVSGDDSVKCDRTGHGTTSVNLIFDMCEMASVYAVRIFEDDEANDKTRDLAIKAIDWCIAEKMDVICMACGFNESNKELFEKIHEASGKMLIFAAPTNESNAGEIAYPARYDSEVFCMFSTNGAITKSQRLNPTKGLGLYNFAIIGEDIRTLNGEEKSGTSFSTAIAAGLASQLLEFSRHTDCRDRIKNAYIMKVKHGMSKIMRAMAMEDEDFHCLKPWKLLPDSLRNQIPFAESSYPTEVERKEAREHICSLIMLSLADTWS